MHGQIDGVQLYDEAHSASSIGVLINNPGVAIPEPSTFALAALGLMFLDVRQRAGR